MKVTLESDSQEEFDEKREDLIKAIAGSKLDVSIKRKDQASHSQERDGTFKAQREMVKYWNNKYQKMIKEIKKEILEVIDE